MRDRYDEIKGKGAEVVVIGQGWPAMAADFKANRKLPFTLLVDQERATYKALEMKRASALEIFGPQVIARGALSFVKGHLQGMAPEGTSLRQLGGAVVVDRGGKVLLTQRSDDASDNISVDEILSVLP